MKLVILAGGLGTRLSEETDLIPKPLVEIGGKPMIWHIMKIYSSFGVNEFIICCGYKGEMIKKFFNDYFLYFSDLEINLSQSSKTKILNNKTENWNIKLIDTGKDTMTGGRIKKIEKYIKRNENFCLTYGDGLSDINIRDLINFHKKHKKLATMTAVKPLGRFGVIESKGSLVTAFKEKYTAADNLINGGFFVLNQKIFKYLSSDHDVWEREPLQNLAVTKELMIYKHNGFWQPMDTLREKNYLNDLWKNQKAPWKSWK